MSTNQMIKAIARDSAIAGFINAAAAYGLTRAMKWSPQNLLPVVRNGIIFKTAEFASSKAQRMQITRRPLDQYGQQQYVTMEDSKRIRKFSAFLGTVSAASLTPILAQLFNSKITYQASTAFTLSSLTLSSIRFYNTYQPPKI